MPPVGGWEPGPRKSRKDPAGGAGGDPEQGKRVADLDNPEYQPRGVERSGEEEADEARQTGREGRRGMRYSSPSCKVCM